jgi:metal-sulfur cluster biosynthetic enzyme
MTATVSREQIEDALRTVDDPEVGVNIVDLGLVYAIVVEGDAVTVEMTMTTPACPLGAYLEDEVTRAVRSAAPEAAAVHVRLVWEPPWSPERMSAAAKDALGWRR